MKYNVLCMTKCTRLFAEIKDCDVGYMAKVRLMKKIAPSTDGVKLYYNPEPWTNIQV